MLGGCLAGREGKLKSHLRVTKVAWVVSGAGKCIRFLVGIESEGWWLSGLQGYVGKWVKDYIYLPTFKKRKLENGTLTGQV